MHVFARVSAAAAALVTALSGSAVPAIHGPEIVEQQESLSMSVGVADGQHQAGTDLELLLSAENGTGRSLDETTAEVSLTYVTIDTRFALDAWLDDQPVLGERAAATVPVPAIGTGSSVTELVIPEASLGLGESPAPGVYGMRISVHGVTTSSVLTVSGSQSTNTSLALIAEITAPPDVSGLFSRTQLTALTSQVGSLDRQLSTVESYPISVGIDPMVETSIYSLTNPPAVARDWLERAHSLEYPFHTPYAQSDILAQLSAGLDPMAPLGFPDPNNENGVSEVLPAVFSSPRVIDATGRSITTDLLRSAEPHGIPLVSTAQLDERLHSPTPSAAVTIDDVNALAVDSRLQQTLNTAIGGDSEGERLSATTELIGLLATISREAPNTPRTLAAMLDPSARGAGDLLEDLNASGWVHLTPIENALQEEPRAVTLSEAEPDETDSALISFAEAVHEQDARVERYAEIAEEPDTIHIPFRLASLAALYSESVISEASLDRQVRSLTDVADVLLESVRILPGSTIQVVGSNVELPIELVNELDENATVTVHIRTTSPIVVVQNPYMEVTVAAGSSQRVLMPVEVIGSGRTSAIVTLETADGEQVSQSVTLRVRAQPEVETVLLILGTASVVLLVGFGFWRSLRKRRAGVATGDLDGAGLASRKKVTESGES